MRQTRWKVNTEMHNDNEFTLGKYNDNVRSRKVDEIADALISKLGNAAYRQYYCKLAWELPEYVIWSNLEVAVKGKSPARYFSWLCQRSLSGTK